jgi:hypothetical protein
MTIPDGSISRTMLGANCHGDNHAKAMPEEEGGVAAKGGYLGE